MRSIRGQIIKVKSTDLSERNLAVDNVKVNDRHNTGKALIGQAARHPEWLEWREPPPGSLGDVKPRAWAGGEKGTLRLRSKFFPTLTRGGTLIIRIAVAPSHSRRAARIPDVSPDWTVPCILLLGCIQTSANNKPGGYQSYESVIRKKSR